VIPLLRRPTSNFLRCSRPRLRFPDFSARSCLQTSSPFFDGSSGTLTGTSPSKCSRLGLLLVPIPRYLAVSPKSGRRTVREKIRRS